MHGAKHNAAHVSASRGAAWLMAGATKRLALYRAWNERDRKSEPCEDSACKRGHIARLEHGKAREPLAIADFVALSGLSFTDCTYPAPLREHPDLPCVAAVPDALLGTNALLEVKAPWRGELDGDAPIALESTTLVQVWMQLECFPEREFAFVVHHCGEYMHVWKVLRDDAAFHEDGVTLWELASPEFRKYAKMVDRADTAAGPEDATLFTTYARIRRGLQAYREHAVHKLTVHLSGAVTVAWARVDSESCTNPTTATLIDRIGAPSAPHGDRRPFAQRFLRIWWTDVSTAAFYDPTTCGDRPERGGVVSSNYYTVSTAPMPRGASAWGVAVR